MGRLQCTVVMRVWLIAVSSFIIGSLCVTWLLPVGVGERKLCENSLVDDRGVLGNCVKYCGEIILLAPELFF